MRDSVRSAEPSDGKTEALPEQHTTLAFDRTYTERQMSLIRRGFIPREMQDKWFIYSRRLAVRTDRRRTGQARARAESVTP